MTVERAAGALLIVLPLAFNAFFSCSRAALRLPEHPPQPDREILSCFRRAEWA
ncbi:MAG: hypothetical protein M3312_06135 [Actinomycetota bacterium]|nr:hypothetical protein [Actinomycetota bacterium]